MKSGTKTITTLFLAVVITFSFGGCFITDIYRSIQGSIFENLNFKDDTDYTAVTGSKSVDSNNYTSNGDITYGYDSLTTEEQKQCYKAIGEAVYRISEEQDEKYGLYPVGKVNIPNESVSETEMNLCIKTFSMDHPEIFWISNRFSYGSLGDQTVIQLYSYISGEECKKRIENLDAAINQIISAVPSGLNEYHLEKWIHNTVLEQCVYASGVKDSDDGWEEFTIYGALVNGSAVCEGYSHSMCFLLNKVGLECYYVSGYSQNEAHMWNTVKVDGNWYHLDATWNDSENTYYNYFNLTDKQIEVDHIISDMYEDMVEDTEITFVDIFNVFLPECSSNSANYYVVESTYIYDFEECRDVIVSDLVAAAENRDEDFYVRLDTSMDYTEAIDIMFNQEPYYIFDYINQANKLLDTDYKIIEKNVSILMLENFNSVVVKLDYE